MSLYFRNLFTFLYCLALALGCGSPENKSSNNSTSVLPDLQGTWKGSCMADPASDGQYMLSSYIISGSSVTYEELDYVDNACSSQYLKIAANVSCTAAGKATLPADSNKLDCVANSVLLTLTTTDLIDTANQNKYFGFSDWKINVPKEVIGLKRDANSEANDAKGTKMYEVYSIQSNVLYFGDTSSGDGTSDSTRATKLETLGFKKQ